MLLHDDFRLSLVVNTNIVHGTLLVRASGCLQIPEPSVRLAGGLQRGAKLNEAARMEARRYLHVKRAGILRGQRLGKQFLNSLNEGCLENLILEYTREEANLSLALSNAR